MIGHWTNRKVSMMCMTEVDCECPLDSVQAYLGCCVTPSIYGLTPGYIVERACREELLDLADMMTSPTQ
jgi:hypothetical protein